MSLNAVVAASTHNPSRVFHFLRDKGTLNNGTPADVAILDLREGEFEYIDNYENVVINITKDVFRKFGKSRPYVINARNYQFKKIYKNYSDAIKFDIKKEFRKEEGKKIALFNKSDYLELSIYKSNPELSGGASSLFGLKYRDVVTISFQ